MLGAGPFKNKSGETLPSATVTEAVEVQAGETLLSLTVTVYVPGVVALMAGWALVNVPGPDHA